ncbi:MAG: hypothetical protein IJ224_00050 [Lachnospiraceae bacterium]|nr:hypothetical protein [Lachnospiraceae bacterium]
MNDIIGSLDKELIVKLSNVKKDTKFIKYVYTMLKTEVQKEKMLEYLNNDSLSEADILREMLKITLK